MLFLTYRDNGLKYPLVLYGRLNQLTEIMETNHNRAKRYAENGNWIIENQNPIVQFIKMMAIDIDWDDEYIFNYVAANALSYASLCNFTCLRNPGHSQYHTLFPEKQHNVLITLPFGEPSKDYKYYFQDEAYQNLYPLKTIFTTDIKQHWDVTKITDKGNPTTGESNYTVVQLDPFALIIGYVRYYRHRVSEGRLVGLTPNAYVCKYPMINFYYQHNLMTAMNCCLDGVSGVEIEEAKFNTISYLRYLKDYGLSIYNGMFGVNPGEIHHFISQCTQLNPHHIGDDGFYPKPLLSLPFIQLGWVYCFSGMRIAAAYGEYCKRVNKVDRLFITTLKKFLIGNPSSLAGKISDPLWNALFKRMFDDLKQYTK